MFENRIIQANKQIKYQCLKTNKVIRLQTGHIETCLQIVFFFFAVKTVMYAMWISNYQVA